MIIQSEKTPWWKLLFQIRGTVLPLIWKRLLATVILACVVTLLHIYLGWFSLTLSTLPFTLVGLALSIFLGFRNNASYERFWEGRKLWGQLTNSSRSLTRQMRRYIRVQQADEQPSLLALQQRVVKLQIAFAHALRMHLHVQDIEFLRPWVAPSLYDKLKQVPNLPLALTDALSDEIAAAWRHGWLDTLHVTMLEQRLHELSEIQGGCERIRSTPIPFGYISLMHQLVALYCLTLPFAIVEHTFAPVIILVVAYAFLGLDAIGGAIQNPFAEKDNDIPLRAICRNIEISLLQEMGENSLPQPLEPINGVLV